MAYTYIILTHENWKMTPSEKDLHLNNMTINSIHSFQWTTSANLLIVHFNECFSFSTYMGILLHILQEKNILLHNIQTTSSKPVLVDPQNGTSFRKINYKRDDKWACPDK